MTSRTSSTPPTRCRPGCNITVRGMAPGASLIGMKVFGAASSAYSSVIIQGMDWAVTHDHADVISESFGGYPIPDTAQDMIRRFNDAAVAAGVTVSQGSGDSGATASPSAPSTDPLVLNAGANTNFRAYAQTVSYAYQFSKGTYLSDNISSIGGGGFGQDAQTVDLVAPGEADWALCTPNTGALRGVHGLQGQPRPGRARLPAAVRRHEPVHAAHRGRRGARHRGLPRHPPGAHAGTGAREADPHEHRQRPRLPRPRAGRRRGRLAEGRPGRDVGRRRHADRPQPPARPGQGDDRRPRRDVRRRDGSGDQHRRHDADGERPRPRADDPGVRRAPRRDDRRRQPDVHRPVRVAAAVRVDHLHRAGGRRPAARVRRVAGARTPASA